MNDLAKKNIDSLYVYDSIINRYFDHVYVLNLENRTDRKLAMLQKLGRLGIKAEFVQAVDGYSTQSLDEYDEYIKSDLGNHPLELSQKRKMIMSSGAWAYLKTYDIILNDAKRRNFSRILCFDDDVIFHSDFESILIQRLSIIPQDWKLLYLGASQHVQKIPQGLSYPDKSKLLIDKNEPYYFPNTIDGSFAIGIDNSVFDVLLHDISKMNCSFDSGALRRINRIAPNKCFVVTPNLVIADVSESDIQGGRSQFEMSKKFHWELKNYDYPFKRDLVTVIMPVYNGQYTIEKAIRSILLQTYCELEVIVVDDASTDETTKVVKRLMNNDNRLKLIEFKENRGVYAARNEAINNSSGVVIANQDADDISLINRIEKQLIPIYEKGMLFTTARIYRSRLEVNDLDVDDQKGMMDLVESRRILNKYGKYDYQDRPIIGLQTSVFRRSIFEQFGLYCELRVAGDLEYLERVLFGLTQNIFNTDFNGHQFISNCSPIPCTFQRLDEVLLVSIKMNSQNITNSFKNREEELNRIKNNFRNHIAESDLNLFIKLDSVNNIEYRIPDIKYNTLIIKQVSNTLERSNLKSKITDAKTKDGCDPIEIVPVNRFSPQSINYNSLDVNDQELQDVYNSWSWKVTVPLRWIGRLFLN
mgnify:FL=1|tara:strand:+ start:99 stop:2027 length:1929 start_codon:yes stop_codon:yes gene_type:complete